MNCRATASGSFGGATSSSTAGSMSTQNTSARPVSRFEVVSLLVTQLHPRRGPGAPRAIGCAPVGLRGVVAIGRAVADAEPTAHERCDIGLRHANRTADAEGTQLPP